MHLGVAHNGARESKGLQMLATSMGTPLIKSDQPMRYTPGGDMTVSKTSDYIKN